jgi:hypothetical protein
MEEKTQTENQKAAVGQIAAAIGAFSVIALFIAADSTFSFARGLLGSLGFPAQIMTLKTSVDFFPGIGYQNTLSFLVSLVAGFLFPVRRATREQTNSKVFLGALLLLLVLSLIGNIWDSLWPSFSGLLLDADFLAPILVGYSYRSLSHGFKHRVLYVGAFILMASLVHETALYHRGRDIAREIATRVQPQLSPRESGLAVVKMSDFPIITLTSKEKLQLSPKAVQDGLLYTYSSNRTCFLRLVAYDDSNYYIIENNGGIVRPMAIRKETVTQMSFLEKVN